MEKKLGDGYVAISLFFPGEVTAHKADPQWDCFYKRGRGDIFANSLVRVLRFFLRWDQV